MITSGIEIIPPCLWQIVVQLCLVLKHQLWKWSVKCISYFHCKIVQKGKSISAIRHFWTSVVDVGFICIHVCVCVCVVGGGGGFVWLILSHFFNIPWKWNNLVSLRPNYFIFVGYFKTGGREGVPANFIFVGYFKMGGREGVPANRLNPLWICRWTLYLMCRKITILAGKM